MNLTPAERNQLRHLRTLLDHYERLPDQGLAVAIVAGAEGLCDAARDGIEQRRTAMQTQADAALRGAGLE